MIDSCHSSVSEVVVGERPVALDHVNWKRLAAVFAVTQSIGFIAMIQIMPVILVPISHDLGVSRTAVAVTSTVSTLAGMFVAVPIGRLLDRHGGRLMMAAGSALGVLAVLWWSQADSLLDLYGAFVLIGTALAMSSYEASFSVLVVATDPQHRDRSILTVTMIAGLTTYLVYPILGWLNSTFGWRDSLLILAATLAVIAVPAHLWAIPNAELHRRRVQRRTGVSVGVALRERRFWLLAAAFTAQATAVSALLLLVVAYLRDVGFSESVASSVPIIVGVLQIGSRLALTTLGRGISMVKATSFAFAVQGIGLLTLPLVGLSLPLTLLCVAGVGLGQGVGVIARPAIVNDQFGATQFGSILMALTVPMSAAKAFSPVGAAWLGDWRFLTIGGVISLVGAASLLPLFGPRTPA